MSFAKSDTARSAAFCLVDANNFYCSCHAIFQPIYWTVPSVTLSNNDGCVVSRSFHAKALGIKMGEPWHLIKDKPEFASVVAFSSNYELYADISSRFMNVLAGMVPAIEIYSIDEGFGAVDGIQDQRAFGIEVRQRIKQWVGLPVCVGFGSTKTRAKLANHIAKKRAEHNGVFSLEALSEEDETALLSHFPVNEVWGVGGKLTQRLNALDIFTVRDLRDAPEKRLREHFSVVLEKTISELRGISCIPLELVAPAKKEIVSSRSFSHEITTFEGLREAVLSYVAIASEKLREQRSTAATVSVGIRTNPFKPSVPQYSRGIAVPLVTATDDTLEIGAAAVAGLKRIYRPGFRYKKAEVMLSGLAPKAIRQAGLFDTPLALERRDRLNSAIDRINSRFGRGALAVAGAGIKKDWSMQRQNLSPAYTTRWDELMVVR